MLIKHHMETTWREEHFSNLQLIIRGGFFYK